MIFKFTTKILRREYLKLLLPFLSILLTTIVIVITYLLVDSARMFLSSKNKEFIGGDISLSSSKSIEVGKYVEKANIKSVSNIIEFQAILSSASSSNVKTISAQLQLVDDIYPLYGQIKLQNNSYVLPDENEVYIDTTISKNLNLNIGDSLLFNNATFTVKDIILEDPTQILAGFSFLGKVIMSDKSINYANVDLKLFRKEYETKLLLNSKYDKAKLEMLSNQMRSDGVRLSSGASGSGIQFGLEIVERFLIVAILIVSILSLVNIYASINYLANRLRRSFSILISIGMPINNIYKILFLITSFVISLAILFGLIFGVYMTSYIINMSKSMTGINLVTITHRLEYIYIFLLIYVTSLFATFPIINRMRKISPKELLSHNNANENKNTIRNVLLDIIIGIFPITLISIYFLDSFLYGSISIGLIIIVYGAVMLGYKYFIDLLYRVRNKMSFSLRLITSQKKFDGFFGLITFASFFVALTAVYNLSIIRTSIDQFLRRDLSRTLPSVYVLDVQSAQRDKLSEKVSGITLFPNVRARINAIDSLQIQTEIENKNPDIDRELGREFNLTYRDYLLSSEKVGEGKFGIAKGEVSVESEFAKRVNIKLNSNLTFNIQGFKVNAKVTSIRQVDTRSGFPFFYFILSPEELANFPQTYFGYSDIKGDKIDELNTFLAKEMPNVSVINTSNITKIAEQVIEVLLVIILIITMPPLLLSAMLVITILASLSGSRKRDGARLMALGKTRGFIRNYYILESVSGTILASGAAYVFALLLSNFVIIKYLDIKNIVYFDFISFYIFVFIIIGIVMVATLLWRQNNKSLREYLNYEENN